MKPPARQLQTTLPTAKPQRRFFKRVLWLTIFALIAAMVILPRVFDAAFFDKELRNYLAQDFGLELKSESLAQFTWWPVFGLRLRDVQFVEIGSNTPLLSAANIDLSLPWVAIRNKQIRLDQIQIENSVVNVVATQNWLRKYFANDNRALRPIRWPRIEQAISIRNMSLHGVNSNPSTTWILRELSSKPITTNAPLEINLLLSKADRATPSYKINIAGKPVEQSDRLSLDDLRIELARADQAKLTPLQIKGQLVYQQVNQVHIQLQASAPQWPLDLHDFGFTEARKNPISVELELRGPAEIQTPLTLSGNVLAAKFNLKTTLRDLIALSNSPDASALKLAIESMQGDIALSEFSLKDAKIKDFRIKIIDDAKLDPPIKH